MIHEIRTYTLVPGKAAEYLRLTGANDIYDPSRHAKAQRFVDRRSAAAGAGE